MLLTGCEEEQTGTAQIAPLKEGDYTYMLPYVKSSTEVTHSKYGSNKKDIFNMGALLRRSLLGSPEGTDGTLLASQGCEDPYCLRHHLCLKHQKESF